jgi:hypothetical protein
MKTLYETFEKQIHIREMLNIANIYNRPVSWQFHVKGIDVIKEYLNWDCDVDNITIIKNNKGYCSTVLYIHMNHIELEKLIKRMKKMKAFI